MRVTPLLLSIALLSCLLVVPTGSAFTYCTSTGLTQYRCSDHVVCVGGGNYGRWNERCQVGVPNDPCDIIACGPGPVLP